MPDMRCQLCGVSGNVGRMRLASEPATAAARRTVRGAPVINEADCVGCFVVTDDGTEDDDDAADVSFIPDNEENPKDAKYEYMQTSSGVVGEDCSDGVSDDDDDDDDDDDGSEMKMDMDVKSYGQFLKGLPLDNCNIIVPLTEEYKQRDQTWRIREHVSGPNCMLRNAYSGQNISAEELRGCNTLQLLCPKPGDWVAEPGDEDFELDGECPNYLSGLRDHLDWTSSATIFSPMRHNQDEFCADDWSKTGADRYLASMLFHPACFEIFKRASLNRFNIIDVEGLAAWYKFESTRYASEKIFAHEEAMQRATEGSDWAHVEGDEWIAANPCFVPALQREMLELATEEPFKGSRLSESRDISYEIDDIAQMNLSSEAPSDLPQSFYFGHIRQDMPWIWEAWCTRPYSGWTTRTQSEIVKDPLAISYQKEYLQNWVKALKADEGTSTKKRAQLRNLNAQIKQLDAMNHFIPEPVSAMQLPRHGTDWRKLYFALKTMGKTSNGLRNRERVWRCCNSILDRIEMWRKSGKKISANKGFRLPSGKHVRADFTTHRKIGMTFADDYSEDEAEFSDGEPPSDDEDMEIGDD